MGEVTRWTVNVAPETDIDVRTYLAQRGMKKGDLIPEFVQAIRDGTEPNVGARDVFRADRGRGRARDEQRAAVLVWLDRRLEGADGVKLQGTALGCGRIDVVEMLEVRLVFEIAEHA